MYSCEMRYPCTVCAITRSRSVEEAFVEDPHTQKHTYYEL